MIGRIVFLKEYLLKTVQNIRRVGLSYQPHILIKILLLIHSVYGCCCLYIHGRCLVQSSLQLTSRIGSNFFILSDLILLLMKI